MLSQSVWHKVLATVLAAIAFVALYQVTIYDSRYAARQAVLRESTALPSAGARLRFSATAYCKGAFTASGVWPRSGVAAADPVLLPVGSVIQVLDEPPYSGVYTIMDTGPMIQGRHIDIYMWSCTEALRFGRRSVEVTILRLGWNPRDSTTDVLPSHPLPLGELERLR
ncbi:MAG: 3D domain-containing protein [Acidobacteriota bacterium]